MIFKSLTGAGYLIKGIKMLPQSGVRLYVIVPLLINITLFGVLLFLGFNYLSDLVDWIMPNLPIWLQWISWLFWLLFALTLVLIAFFTFTFIANIVGAPFNSMLAEAVEFKISGNKAATKGFMQGLTDVGPSIVSEVKKMAYFLTWSIPFLILFFIPVIQIFAPFVWFIFTAWMLSLEYIEYPMGNHEFKFEQVRARLRKNKFMSLGFGSAVMLCTMIPIGNFLVMPAAVAGGTVFWWEKLKDQDNRK